MNDETLETTDAGSAAMAANAVTALAVQELTERVEQAEKRLKTAWIAIALVGVLVVALSGWTLVGRAVLGRPGVGAFPGRGMGSGTYQQFQNQN